MSTFTQILRETPEDLLLPSESTCNETLGHIKSTLDPIARKYSIFDAVHVDGLDAEQVWVQAQMIVDGAVEKLFGRLSAAAGQESEESDQEVDSGSEEGDLGVEDSEELSEIGEEDDSEAVDQLHDDFDDYVSEGGDDPETLDVDEELEEQGAEEVENSGESEEKVAVDGPGSLNTGLFNLADFQQQVLALEHENDENDDEELDYFTNVQDESDEGDLKYADFFAPPPKKQKYTKKDKQAFAEDQEIEEAFSSTRKDLFDDEDDEEDEEVAGEQLSRHERQQLEIQRQIEQLEAENVGEKFWAAKGEVKATQRPQDSLVNTEIEFERNAKPAPVITQEITDTLEEMIKERIKKQLFDDLPRRLAPGPAKPKRELVELSEQKSDKNLAELYEDEQLKAENPEYYASKDTAQLAAVHKEISDLYGVLARKLDALSSWHYTPKAPKPSLTVVSDAAAISMEEAQPTAMATGSMLAPQEIYKSGSKSKSEVVGRDNLPISRDEMSTADKHKARRKAKAKKAKEMAKRAQPPTKDPKAKDSKQEMFDTLKKGNVSYMDKRGQKRDMRGNVVKNGGGSVASHVKL